MRKVCFNLSQKHIGAILFTYFSSIETMTHIHIFDVIHILFVVIAIKDSHIFPQPNKG